MIVQINANVRTLGFVCLMSVAGTMSAVAAPAAPIYGPNLESFAYPHPVQWFDFESQGMRLQMAYMDVAPAIPNGRTAVLLHGKNFTAATGKA